MGRHVKQITYDSTPRQIYCRVPVFMSMMLEEKIAEYNFRDRTEVILYLLENYLDNANDLPVSKTVLKIYKYMPDRPSPVVLKAPDQSFILNLPGNRVNELARVATEKGYNTRISFICAIMEAFLVVPPRLAKSLCEEINRRNIVNISNERVEFSTYVSRLQYNILQQKAKMLGTSLSGLLRTALNVLFTIENSGSSILPCVIIQSMKQVISIKGSTLKRFNRDICIQFVLPDIDEQTKARELMIKHNIAGYHEFTRRLVLFFVNSEEYVDSCNTELEVEDDFEMEEDGDYWYGQLVKTDFARSIYK